MPRRDPNGKLALTQMLNDASAEKASSAENGDSVPLHDLNPEGRPLGRSMWERLSEFLFENSAIASVQFENWMWLIGVPVLIICLYFSERGFHWKTRDPPGG